MNLSFISSVINLAVGFLMVFVGWDRFPKKSFFKAIKSIHFGLFGAALGFFVVTQVEHINNDNSVEWLWVFVSVPLGAALLFIAFNSLGMIAIGVYCALSIGQALLPEVQNTISRDVFLQACGFVGAIVAGWTFSKNISLINMFISAFCGGAMMLNALNCFVNEVPAARPLDVYVVENLSEDESLPCGKYFTDTAQLMIFLVASAGIAFIGVILQIFISVRVSRYTKMKKARAMTPEEIEREKQQHWDSAKDFTERLLEMQEEEKTLGLEVSNDADYMPFRAHDKILKTRLRKLGLQERPCGESYTDSQLAAVADQLKSLGIDESPATIRKNVVKWLRRKVNWNLLANMTGDPFQMNTKQQAKYVNSLQHGAWADTLTLQAIVQIYRVPIMVISSVSGPQCIRYYNILEDFDSKTIGKVIFITFDGQRIETSKSLAMQSPVLSSLILKSKGNREIVMTNPRQTAENLRATLSALEVSNTEALDAFGVSHLSSKPRVELEDVQKKELIRLCYYSGFHYGSLESIPRDLGSTELEDDDPFMRTWTRPYLRIVLIRAVQIGIIITGVWWLIWMLIWGRQFGNFFEGFSFLLFFLAELVNFVLGIIFNLNFWYPIHRQWKSLDRLTNPKFTKPIVVNTMIFHYSEPASDTQRTLKGAIRMNKTKNTNLRIFICDDGFWVKKKSNAEPSAPKETFWDKLKKKSGLMPPKANTDLELAEAKELLREEIDEERNEEEFLKELEKKKQEKEQAEQAEQEDEDEDAYPSSGKPRTKSVSFHLGGKRTNLKEEVERDDEVELESIPVAPVRRLSTRLRSMSTLTVWDDSQWQEEEFNAFRHPLLEYVELKYNFLPRPSSRTHDGAKGMIDAIRQEVYRYYSEKVHRKVYVKFTVELKTPDEDVVEYEGNEKYQTEKLYRTDCSKASLSYHFYATYYPHHGVEKRIPGPEVVLVARIKPDEHHYKAGNINNCVYNERLQGSFAVFLDNDMKPKSDFLMRTLPWFYYYSESDQDYRENESICFVQTPQFFKDETIDYNDFLGGRNSVFFQGIQSGRDGFDLCSFAGTNAIFRLRALYSVGGLPYGSVTEDSSLAIHLHQYGYRSIYIPDYLCVGLAPVTPANSMQQRSRWVKGSVQMFLNSLNPWFKHKRFDLAWRNHPIFEGDSPERVAALGCPPSYVPTRTLFQKAYQSDTLLYPFSAVTAINYMLVAVVFIITLVPPVNFGQTAQAFLYTFVPYFFLKNVSQFLSYYKVRANDIWVAQQVWFSYAFASLYGILDAFKEALTGSGFGGWGVTGEGKRTSNLEWFNVTMVIVMLVSLLIRAILLLVQPLDQEAALGIAAMFFVCTIVIHMWPMASSTIYEWLYNSHLAENERKDLQRIKIPNYIIYAFILIMVIVVVEFKDLDTKFISAADVPDAPA